MVPGRGTNACQVFPSLPASQFDKKITSGDEFIEKFAVYSILAVTYIQNGQPHKGGAPPMRKSSRCIPRRPCSGGSSDPCFSASILCRLSVRLFPVPSFYAKRKMAKGECAVGCFRNFGGKGHDDL
jgi:hypothetical protein